MKERKSPPFIRPTHTLEIEMTTTTIARIEPAALTESMTAVLAERADVSLEKASTVVQDWTEKTAAQSRDAFGGARIVYNAARKAAQDLVNAAHTLRAQSLAAYDEGDAREGETLEAEADEHLMAAQAAFAYLALLPQPPVSKYTLFGRAVA
jgi:hypothetical protein